MQFKKSMLRCAMGLLVMIFVLNCRTVETVEEVPEVDSVRQYLQYVREMYEPRDCMQSRFSLEMNSPGESRQRANGNALIDNIDDRLRLQISEPLLGVTVATVTVRDDMVHVRSMRQENQDIPIRQLEMNGLGLNSMQLPFYLFQDLLYGRIPEEVFDSEAKKTFNQESGQLTVEVDNVNETVVYLFEDYRLRLIDFQRSGTSETINIALTGIYNNSIYPETIDMTAGREGQPGDELSIRFRGLNESANCDDSQFQI